VTLLFCFAIYSTSCKKKEERDLIKQYLGIYDVVHITQGIENGHIVTAATEQIDLEVKKSCRGIKIKKVLYFENFDVDYSNNTFSAYDDKIGKSAIGRFLPNDSISLTINLSDKLPLYEFYRMKKKN
jgi:hypothetical protein